MKTTAIVVLSAAIALSASSAWAWNQVKGKVTSVDAKTHMIALDNGTTYTASKSVKLSSVKVGDTVTVSAETKKGKNMVNKVTKST